MSEEKAGGGGDARVGEAGEDRLVDYFVVLGAPSSGHVEQIAGFEQKSSDPCVVRYKAETLFRFPEKDIKEKPLPGHIWLFCFPDGLRLSRRQLPSSVVTFVLTELDGAKFYGTCVIVYEPYSAHFGDAKRKHEPVVVHSRSVPDIAELGADSEDARATEDGPADGDESKASVPDEESDEKSAADKSEPADDAVDDGGIDRDQMLALLDTIIGPSSVALTASPDGPPEELESGSADSPSSTPTSGRSLSVSLPKVQMESPGDSVVSHGASKREKESVKRLEGFRVGRSHSMAVPSVPRKPSVGPPPLPPRPSSVRREAGIETASPTAVPSDSSAVESGPVNRSRASSSVSDDVSGSIDSSSVASVSGFYAPKAYLILSCHPFFQVFRDWLRLFSVLVQATSPLPHTVSSDVRPAVQAALRYGSFSLPPGVKPSSNLLSSSLRVPLESYIGNLLYSVPVPIPGTLCVSFKFPFTTLSIPALGPTATPGSEISLRQTEWNAVAKKLEHTFLLHYPCPDDYPLVDFPLEMLLRSLSVRSIVEIVTLILNEQKIVFHSSQYTTLTYVAQAFVTLLYPFVYPHIFIPVLPLMLLDFLNAPMPFLCGIHSSYEAFVPPSLEVAHVYLDTDELQNCIAREELAHVEKLPEAIAHFLTLNLRRIASPSIFGVDSFVPRRVPAPEASSYRAFAASCTSTMCPTFRETNAMIRDVFLGMFVKMFRDFRRYIFFLRLFPKPIPVFKKRTFLKNHPESATFLSKFLESQFFACFLEDLGCSFLRNKFDSDAERSWEEERQQAEPSKVYETDSTTGSVDDLGMSDGCSILVGGPAAPVASGEADACVTQSRLKVGEGDSTTGSGEAEGDVPDVDGGTRAPEPDAGVEVEADAKKSEDVGEAAQSEEPVHRTEKKADESQDVVKGEEHAHRRERKSSERSRRKRDGSERDRERRSKSRREGDSAAGSRSRDSKAKDRDKERKEKRKSVDADELPDAKDDQADSEQPGAGERGKGRKVADETVLNGAEASSKDSSKSEERSRRPRKRKTPRSALLVPSNLVSSTEVLPKAEAAGKPAKPVGSAAESHAVGSEPRAEKLAVFDAPGVPMDVVSGKECSYSPVLQSLVPDLVVGVRPNLVAVRSLAQPYKVPMRVNPDTCTEVLGDDNENELLTRLREAGEQDFAECLVKQEKVEKNRVRFFERVVRLLVDGEGLGMDATRFLKALKSPRGPRIFALALGTFQEKLDPHGCLSHNSFDLVSDMMIQALNEAVSSSDYLAVKLLMDDAMQIYREVAGVKDFVSSRIKEHQAFLDMAFWENAVYDAIGAERRKEYGSEFMNFVLEWSSFTAEKQRQLVAKEESSIFSQIGKYVFSMLNVGCPIRDIRRFMNRMCGAAGLSDDHTQTLEAVLSNMSRASELEENDAPDDADHIGRAWDSDAMMVKRSEEAVLSRSQSLTQWRTLVDTRRPKPKGPVMNALFRASRRPTRMLAGGQYLDVESTEKYTILTYKGHGEAILSMHVLDSPTMVSGSFDGTVRVWDRRSSSCLHILQGHSSPVQCVQMHQGKVISASFDHMVKLWDLVRGRKLRTLRGHRGPVSCLAVEGQRILTGSLDYSLKLWDARNGKRSIMTLVGHTSPVSCCQLSLSHNLAFSGSRDNTLKCWDLRSGKGIYTLVGHTDWVKSLDNLNAKTLVSGSHDHDIRVWDVSTGRCTKLLKGHAGIVHAAQFYDDKYVVSGSEDSTVKVWDFGYGRCVHTLKGHTDEVLALKCAPNVRNGCVVSGGIDASVLLWDMSARSIDTTFLGHTKPVSCVEMDSEGNVYSGSSDSTIKCFKLSSSE